MSLRGSLVVALAFTGCGPLFPATTRTPPPETEEDTGEPADTGLSVDSDASEDDAETDASDVDTEAPELERVVVATPREMRAVWVATVWNINYPSRKGLSATQLRAELEELVDLTEQAGLNAIVFQARPESDALYESDLEPWSRFLTGTQGNDPGIDPLQELIDLAHARHIEVHAWLNPYRAKVASSDTIVAPHIAKAYPQYAYVYRGMLWMDPGAAPVRQRVVEVCVDLASRYDIDGIHFDDYFYPYPDGTPFPDSATYSASGTSLSLGDWRRQNVHDLVEGVHEALEEVAPWVRFGIAPFGIYRPGYPEGITGLDQYTALYSDPMEWVEQNWIDYMSPQLYWAHDNPGQEFPKLMEWWADNIGEGQYIWPGLNLSALGESDFPLEEFELQTELSRSEVEPGQSGQLWYSMAPLQEDRQGVVDWMHDTLYPLPADSPPISRVAGVAAEPQVTPTAAGANLAYEGDTPLRGYRVYVEMSGEWVPHERLPPEATSVSLGAGKYAVSALDRAGRESLGVVFSVP